MAVIHISEEEAARDLHELIEKVAAGETVHIDSAARTFAIVPVAEPRTWTVDEALRRSAASGVHACLDDDYADDMEEIMRVNRAVAPSVIPERRSIDEAIRMSEADGSHVLLDDEFGDDMEAIMRRHREQPREDPWASS